MESRCEVSSEKTKLQCIRDGGHTLAMPHVGVFWDDGSFEVWADDGSPITAPCRGISFSGHNCTESLGHSGVHQYGSENWLNNPFNYVTDISVDLMHPDFVPPSTHQMMNGSTFAVTAGKLRAGELAHPPVEPQLGYTTEEFLEGVKDGSRQIREAFENERYSQDVEDAGEVMKAALKDDPVNYPSHYTAYPGIEVIDLTKRMNFCRGNAVKYIARAGLKDPSKEIEDLEKAVFYINKEIEMLKEKSDG